MQINSLYGKKEVNYGGEVSSGKYDTGFLYTNEKTPIYFRLANIQTLKTFAREPKLDYLGFPTENLFNE